MAQVLSYQVADSIDIRALRTTHKKNIVHYDADELFYQLGDGKFVYAFRYGVICFLGCGENETTAFMEKIRPFCKSVFGLRISEEFEVETDARENKFGFNKIGITKPDVEVFRLIMLNVGQSVALDYFSEQTNLLQEETNSHTLFLERHGRLNISRSNLTKYIGKTLNLKNRIAENLYIFDSPPETWEDENLNRIDQGLKRTFDLRERYREIREGLEIVRENLELFKDLLQYRQSTFLEWIIIVLISVEVVNLILGKVFHF